MEKSGGILENRKKKIQDLKNIGVNSYPNDFKVLHTIGDIRGQIEAASTPLTEDGPVFTAAGRIMAINKFGKSAFIRFKDRTGTMQTYIRKDKVGSDAFAVYKLLDIGDFIGLTGPVFATKSGEWTILATDLKLVSKSIRPLPEKYNKLKDPEKRYRQRYLDLIMNEDTRTIFMKRSRIIQSIRNFLLSREFMEVETPMMQAIPGGAEATPFVTHHNALGMDLYLRIAPELYLKRLVVGGFERVFEINRNFRNEGVSTRHNPEFTMLEFYQAYATYQDLIQMTMELFQSIALELTGGSKIVYQNHEIEFGGKWPSIPLLTALQDIGGVDGALLDDREALLRFADSKGITVTKTERLGKVITKLFDALVEPHLIQPTFITGYPVEVSPLSRKNDEQPEITERFELFIAGTEIANGFSELNDPQDQKERFLQQVADREAGNTEAHQMDDDYITALEFGMPPAAGEGIGIDRLIMLFTDSASIREVIFFPHMKRQQKTG